MIDWVLVEHRQHFSISIIILQLRFRGYKSLVGCYSFSVLSLVFSDSGIAPGGSLILYSSAVNGEYPCIIFFSVFNNQKPDTALWATLIAWLE